MSYEERRRLGDELEKVHPEYGVTEVSIAVYRGGGHANVRVMNG